MAESTIAGRSNRSVEILMAATAAAHGPTVVRANERPIRETGVNRTT